MQTRSLETLVRIDQVQSFSKAAELQNMTLSALSMQMKALENELNARLFDRSFRPPKLTPLGRQVASQAERVLNEQNMLTGLCNPEAGLAGVFRLGVVSSVSCRLLPSFLQDFLARAPKASFELSIGLSEQLSEQVSLGLIDGAVVTRVSEPPKGLHYELICSEEMALAVPADYADLPIRDLAEQLPFIHFRPTTGIGKLITESMQTHSGQLQKSIVLDNLEAIVEFVKAGLGFTKLPLPDLLRCADERVYIHSGRSDAVFRELVFASRGDGSDNLWGSQITEAFRKAAAWKGDLVPESR